MCLESVSLRTRELVIDYALSNRREASQVNAANESIVNCMRKGNIPVSL